MNWTRTGGADEGPLLVLLHGLGATGEVWAGVEALLPDAWDGGWLVVDLPGHGRSGRLASYGFADHAAALAPLLPEDREVVVLGHSLGGLVGLELATRRPVARVATFATKTWWPPEQVEAMRAVAAKPPRVFATRAEAVDRYLKQAGLVGLVDPAGPAVGPRVRPGVDGWVVAQDPRTHDFGTPDVAAQLARVPCPVSLARGSEDTFVTAEQLVGLGPDVVTMPGLGHNPHVQDPAAVVALLSPEVGGQPVV
jgi:pimeloyl-ACP methyl ester carboxylesterase